MKFKIGDKVKIISLLDTERRYKLDLYGYMETCLNKVFTIKDIEETRVRFEEKPFFSWSKHDLILVNNNLEIE